MSLTGSQQKVFLRLLTVLRPNWHSDVNLPAGISEVFAANRSFGSRDRRLYRELIYTTLRYLPWIEPLLDAEPSEAVRRIAWFSADLPATKAFRAAFAIGDAPPGDESELLPQWFRPHCPEIFEGRNLETQ